VAGRHLIYSKTLILTLHGYYLLFYTLLASLPLLFGMLFVYNSLGSLCLFMLCIDSSLVGGLIYVCIVLAFLAKMFIFIYIYTYIQDFGQKT